MITHAYTNQYTCIYTCTHRYVRAEAIINMAAIVRVFPEMKAVVVPSLSRCLRRIEDNEAKAAVIWMIGEFGEEIIEAPYMIEPIIDSYDDDLIPVVKLHLLVAAMKLFFKRPPEMQKMLGRLLKSAINDLANQDVHDRALLYHRLLSTDVSKDSSILFPFEYSCVDYCALDGFELKSFMISSYFKFSIFTSLLPSFLSSFFPSFIYSSITFTVLLVCLFVCLFVCLSFVHVYVMCVCKHHEWS